MWLKRILSVVPDTDWLLVFGHHPIISGYQIQVSKQPHKQTTPTPPFFFLNFVLFFKGYPGDFSGGFIELRKEIQPLLEQFKADAYFCG